MTKTTDEMHKTLVKWFNIQAKYTRIKNKLGSTVNVINIKLDAHKQKKPNKALSVSLSQYCTAEVILLQDTTRHFW